MSIHKTAMKGALWLAVFKIVGQSYQWAITILVARILLPSDYGLMAMSFIVIGLAIYIADFGLGAAIVQKKDISEKDLSSIFWFALMVSMLLALIAFFMAYPMADFFNEPKVIPIIQALSLSFPLLSITIIPMNLLLKELQFKVTGLNRLKAVVIASSCVLVIAMMGGGVWALVAGFYLINIFLAFFTFISKPWRPHMHFSLHEIKDHLSFGMNVFFGRTFHYIFISSDRFFGGRAWNSQVLGYYDFALDLAKLPTEKITTLINQVSYPVLSKLQHDNDEFIKFYLNVLKATAILVLPLFVGGFLLGGELVKVILNEKWYPIIFVFEWLCLSQIITSLTAINSWVHYSQNRPNWALYFDISLAVLMGISFYFAVQYGIEGAIVPWFTTYLLLCSIMTIVTLRKIGIKIRTYIKVLSNPILAVIIMSAGVLLFELLINMMFELENKKNVYLLIMKIGVGSLTYFSYFWLFDRGVFHKFKELRGS